MKITEAIKSLTDILANAGNIDLVDVVPMENPEHWGIERKVQFDVFGIREPGMDGETLICALMGTELFCECDEDDKRPRLALVKAESSDVKD